MSFNNKKIVGEVLFQNIDKGTSLYHILLGSILELQRLFT